HTIDVYTQIEEFFIAKNENTSYYAMLQVMYKTLNQSLFTGNVKPEPVKYIDDIASYNKEEGLALSDDEVAYLEEVSKKNKRKLTDSEVFGFSQVKSEHCRHKIFNGTFVIDGKEKPDSLFSLIRKTSQKNPNTIVSAYKDNVSFVQGPKAMQFAPKTQNKADFFETSEID